MLASKRRNDVMEYPQKSAAHCFRANEIISMIYGMHYIPMDSRLALRAILNSFKKEEKNIGIPMGSGTIKTKILPSKQKIN